MTIPQPRDFEQNKPKMPINPFALDPNHDTDGNDDDGTDTTGNHDTDRYCDCSHAKADHEPLRQPADLSQPPTWQCLYCACTKAYPKPAPATH